MTGDRDERRGRNAAEWRTNEFGCDLFSGWVKKKDQERREMRAFRMNWKAWNERNTAPRNLQSTRQPLVLMSAVRHLRTNPDRESNSVNSFGMPISSYLVIALAQEYLC